MSDSLRLFIAFSVSSSLLRLPNGRRSALANVLRELSFCCPSVNPTVPDKLHVTLKFLGATPADRVAAIEQSLCEIASRTKSFEVTLRGLGVFPDVRRPAVCWAGFRDSEPLRTLAEAVENAISPLGFPRERRAFHPHVTLARIRAKPAEKLFELLAEHASTDFGTDHVSELRLMQYSWPQPGEYRTLQSWRLTD